jgi:hypothetical protein
MSWEPPDLAVLLVEAAVEVAGEGTTAEGDEAVVMREAATQGVGDMAAAEVAVVLVLIVEGTVI